MCRIDRINFSARCVCVCVCVFVCVCVCVCVKLIDLVFLKTKWVITCDDATSCVASVCAGQSMFLTCAVLTHRWIVFLSSATPTADARVESFHFQDLMRIVIVENQTFLLQQPPMPNRTRNSPIEVVSL